MTLVQTEDGPLLSQKLEQGRLVSVEDIPVEDHQRRSWLVEKTEPDCLPLLLLFNRFEGQPFEDDYRTEPANQVCLMDPDLFGNCRTDDNQRQLKALGGKQSGPSLSQAHVVKKETRALQEEIDGVFLMVVEGRKRRTGGVYPDRLRPERKLVYWHESD